jgi:hypothetical protein
MSAAMVTSQLAAASAAARQASTMAEPSAAAFANCDVCDVIGKGGTNGLDSSFGDRDVLPGSSAGSCGLTEELCGDGGFALVPASP